MHLFYGKRQASVFQSAQIGTLTTAISLCSLPSTAKYAASSSYAVEFPTPFNDPTVASERCTRNQIYQSCGYGGRRFRGDWTGSRMNSETDSKERY